MSQLLVIDADASTHMIDNEYRSIRAALDEAPMDCARGYNLSAYVDDEGLLNALELNVVASLFVGRPLYGPAVIIASETGPEGETLPVDEHTNGAMIAAAERWRNVIANAELIGQDLAVYANPDTLPPPRIIPMPDDWMPGDPWPTDEKGDPL